jgi:hypothetical protein
MRYRCEHKANQINSPRFCHLFRKRGAIGVPAARVRKLVQFHTFPGWSRPKSSKHTSASFRPNIVARSRGCRPVL